MVNLKSVIGCNNIVSKTVEDVWIFPDLAVSAPKAGFLE